MIKLKNLIVLQILFVIASVVILILSVRNIEEPKNPLIFTDMVLAMVLIVLYALSLFLILLENKLWYRAAMLFAILIFGGIGIVGNIIGYLLTGLEFFASLWDWLMAIIVNAFGTVLNGIGFLGKYIALEGEKNQ